MILVGTSGFQYRDWTPVFYPRSLDPRFWLRFYSRCFGCCELVMTHYRIPEPTTIQEFMEEGGGSMQFVFRIPFQVVQALPENGEMARQFVAALWPLWEAGQLAGVVARFGPDFAFIRDNFDHLCRLRDTLGGFQLVAEFGCPDWRTERAAGHLRKQRIALACIDGVADDEVRSANDEAHGTDAGGRRSTPEAGALQPAPRTPYFATAPLSYVRFQGRNWSRWRRQDGSEQHDYLYSRAELEAALPEIRRLERESERVLVLMNNPWRGQAAVNACMLTELLREGGDGHR